MNNRQGGQQLALPLGPRRAESDMSVHFRARVAGWDSTPWCTPPEASILAPGWREAALRYLSTLEAT